MENIYKAPQADLIVGETTGMDFYVVSKAKFVLLFLLTFGLYSYYWVYKNWQLQKIKTGEAIWPVCRSLVAIFFVPGILMRVDFNKNALGISRKWHPDLLSVLFILLAITMGVMRVLTDNAIGEPYTKFSFIPFLFLECLILYRAQLMINLVSGDADGKQNKRLTPMNIFWIVIGVLYWLVVTAGLVATFHPEVFK